MLKRVDKKPWGFHPEPDFSTLPALGIVPRDSEEADLPNSCRDCLANLRSEIGERLQKNRDFCYFAIIQLIRFYRCPYYAIDKDKHHAALAEYTGEAVFLKKIKRHKTIFHSTGFPPTLTPRKKIECVIEGTMNLLRDVTINYVEVRATDTRLLLESQLVMRAIIKPKIINKIIVKAKYFLVGFHKKWDRILNSPNIPIDMEDFPAVSRLQTLLEKL